MPICEAPATVTLVNEGRCFDFRLTQESKIHIASYPKREDGEKVQSTSVKEDALTTGSSHIDGTLKVVAKGRSTISLELGRMPFYITLRTKSIGGKRCLHLAYGNTEAIQVQGAEPPPETETEIRTDQICQVELKTPADGWRRWLPWQKR